MEPEVGYIDPYDAMAMLPSPEEMQRRAALINNYLAGRAGELRDKGIEADRRVVQGPVVEAIISAAESLNADLIAMASHGRGGLGRVFYGSVAAGVLQRIDRPLLLVRARSSD
jgi:nucleotide-binding universal stress UspA family protein